MFVGENLIFLDVIVGYPGKINYACVRACVCVCVLCVSVSVSVCVAL